MRRASATYASDRVCHSPLVATRSTLTDGVFQSQAHDAAVGCLSEVDLCNGRAETRGSVGQCREKCDLLCSPPHTHTHTHTPHTYYSGENKHAAQ
jgi:hypothetical protein